MCSATAADPFDAISASFMKTENCLFCHMELASDYFFGLGDYAGYLRDPTQEGYAKLIAYPVCDSCNAAFTTKAKLR